MCFSSFVPKKIIKQTDTKFVLRLYDKAMSLLFRRRLDKNFVIPTKHTLKLVKWNLIDENTFNDLKSELTTSFLFRHPPFRPNPALCRPVDFVLRPVAY